MREQPFYNSKGRLTRYGLACGYVEQTWINETHVSLWMEHSTLHVRAHDHSEGKRLLWDSFSTVTEARKDFDKTVRSLNKGEKK
jgi:hypothetical protein